MELVNKQNESSFNRTCYNELGAKVEINKLSMPLCFSSRGDWLARPVPNQ